jgi:HlyD family type I secretion membrane fusion protein
MTEATPAPKPRNVPVIATDARPWVLFGIFWVMLIFAGFGGWAATAPLSSAVIAQGGLAVDSKRKQIQHLEGGIVEKLLVRDGDVVAPGATLVKLDETRPRSMLAIIESSLRKELASEARLIAERDGSAEIGFPAELTGEPGHPEIKALVDSQRAIFRARRDSVNGEVAILKQRTDQLADEIKGLSAQFDSKHLQLGFIDEELRGLKQLMEQGQTTKPRVLALERTAAALKGEQGELLSNIARSNKAIGEANLEAIQREKNFQKVVTEELEAVQARLRDLQERAVAARDVLKRIYITAPVGGTVVSTAVHTVGAVIKPGETIMEIVPGQDSLIAELFIQPHDIDNVTLDQEAAIRLLAFKQRTTPLLNGTVTYVSADSLENPMTKQHYYLAKVAVPQAEIEKLGALKLQPGMQVEVMIRTGDRTAFQYLMQPLMDSVNRAWRED